MASAMEPAFDERGDVHILFQFLAGIFGDDARLESAGVGIQRGSDVRNFPVKDFGIRFRVDFDGVAHMNVGEFALIDIDEDPDGAHVGDGETLGCAGLQQLAGADEALDNFSAHGSENGNLASGLRRIFEHGTSGSFTPRARRASAVDCRSA